MDLSALGVGGRGPDLIEVDGIEFVPVPVHHDDVGTPTHGHGPGAGCWEATVARCGGDGDQDLALGW